MAMHSISLPTIPASRKNTLGGCASGRSDGRDASASLPGMDFRQHFAAEQFDRPHDAFVRNRAVLQKEQDLVRAGLAIAARDAQRFAGRSDRDQIVVFQKVIVVARYLRWIE